MKMKVSLTALFAVTVVTLSTIAPAAVTFDPSTGTGFVGKGDVQTVFGWNDHQLQLNATGVSFQYTSQALYRATCTWTTGEGTRGESTHNVSHRRSTSIESEIVYDTRRNSQNKVTGFVLLGNGASSQSGAVPTVGDPCMGNQGHGGLWSDVEQDVLASSSALFVAFGGTSVAIA